ncbi:hypothetical protein SBV1_960070 [Verrucomicrobia bacterium]|nr:hypothetical protein SBV1_960070 [Verrucomicrobiota bacterium]
MGGTMHGALLLHWRLASQFGITSTPAGAPFHGNQFLLRLAVSTGVRNGGGREQEFGL